MALTSEVLKANAQTAGLSDEQINSIVEMSQNDENAVIGKRIGEVYRQLDEDIAKTSGIQRQETEKTYDYAKRVIGEIKTQAGNATQLQTQVNELTKERDRLQRRATKYESISAGCADVCIRRGNTLGNTGGRTLYNVQDGSGLELFDQCFLLVVGKCTQG